MDDAVATPGPGGPVRVAVVGAGSRGRTYASYAEKYPDRARVVAVADPLDPARDALAGRHDVPATHRFADWRDLAARPRLADAVVLTTPDREHAEPAQRFAELEYAVLLEKPIGRSPQECSAVVNAAERAGIVLGIAHVLRYTHYTSELRKIVHSGRLGDVIGVQHVEPVGWWHFAHSYVRGNWRRADESSFTLLTKCCHDFDWLRHVVGRPARRVYAVGQLRHFHPKNRPAGAADRCLDCAVELDCPYSAVRQYVGYLGDPRREHWPLSVVTPDLTEPGVRAALRSGPYGRCVYACDNDVVDHQVVTIEFDGGPVATLTMSAFTPAADRRTQIMGTRGHLDGDGTTLTVSDFRTGSTRTIRAEPTEDGPHGGGDYGVMNAFVSAIRSGDRRSITQRAREALEGHLMAFAAEQSRRTGAPVDLG